eukprot:CAMPEP_0170628134 /NCGR_PEP_ID=MMETSP0224-20130122/32467_1 /TAXON_ID=285029 /ORGANISM="Togula jolla, Strain CCCM 725" /LENGTH=210 /DNA_ID=CAMNT_0010955429 /DNA_START=16 /DNA_END=649 /DNA_ORIENTATION=-
MKMASPSKGSSGAMAKVELLDGPRGVGGGVCGGPGRSPGILRGLGRSSSDLGVSGLPRGEALDPMRRTPRTQLRTKDESQPACTLIVKTSLLCSVLRETTPMYRFPLPLSIRILEGASREMVMRVALPITKFHIPELVASMCPKFSLKGSTIRTGGSAPGVKTMPPMCFNTPSRSTKLRPTLLSPSLCFTMAVNDVCPDSRQIEQEEPGL